MEGIYWRYYHSIRSYKLVGLIFVLLIPIIGSSQNKSDEDIINHFLTTEMVSLLQKANDYKTISSNTSNLREALSSEISSLSFAINPVCIIEYDKADQDGREVTISDVFLAFLINYAGKSNKTPVINIECHLNSGSDYHVYFRSTAVTEYNNALSKAIFRKSANGIELRRISFADAVPRECEKEKNIQDKKVITIPGVTNVASHQAHLRAQEQLPRITIREATIINGQAVIYGFIRNHKDNGLLTDLDNNANIRVSQIDGYFAITKPLNGSGHRALSFRYQYGNKFITDRKLIFLKP